MHRDGKFVGRVWRPELAGPAVVAVRNGGVFDVTTVTAPTVRDLCELADPLAYLDTVAGEHIGTLEELESNSREGARDPARPWLLAPCDLQVIKACGVTFAKSMVERVIEERAAGDPEVAEGIRTKIAARVGLELAELVPGSRQAGRAKQALQEEGLWSQYLEVGIGPDAEVFTKAPVLSAVGTGARIGIHPISNWNNPEPEVVLCVNSRGQTVGATLGNDVNLRDVEGRSALLLGKAKDNNASCAIGPFIRLFDRRFSMDDLRSLTLQLRVDGGDGFVLQGQSDMSEISRDPLDLVAQTINDNHAYPDGFLLFCGTLFTPTQDRDEPGGGFTHHIGDRVAISAAGLGVLENHVHHCAECERWDFSASHLMRSLSARGLLPVAEPTVPS